MAARPPSREEGGRSSSPLSFSWPLFYFTFIILRYCCCLASNFSLFSSFFFSWLLVIRDYVNTSLLFIYP